VLAPVHRSNIDTPLVAGVTPSDRRLCYMGKDSMWRHKVPGWLFTGLGGFPVKRGMADRAALRLCLDVLNRGEPLVVFPEGGRRSGPVIGEISEGAAYLAIRAGVPIVPVGIGGSERAMTKGSWKLRPVRTSVVIGPPLYPPVAGAGSGRAPRRVVHELTERLRAEMQRLFDEAQARVGE
jgi:1-acyl-sn-glycerol-3-phosphate acyltransferase